MLIQKLSKKKVLYLFVFFIAWGPFSIVNFICAFFKSASLSPSQTLLNVLTWIGYISSSINPIIYTAVNEKFRYAFVQILRCNYKALGIKNQTLNNNNTKVISKTVSQNLFINNSDFNLSSRGSQRFSETIKNHSQSQNKSSTTLLHPFEEINKLCP
jgi:hypothetical protein